MPGGGGGARARTQQVGAKASEANEANNEAHNVMNKNGAATVKRRSGGNGDSFTFGPETFDSTCESEELDIPYEEGGGGDEARKTRGKPQRQGHSGGTTNKQRRARGTSASLRRGEGEEVVEKRKFEFLHAYSNSNDVAFATMISPLKSLLKREIIVI